MKWIVIGLGAVGLALAAAMGAVALTTRGAEQPVVQVVTIERTSPTAATTAPAAPAAATVPAPAPAPAATKPAAPRVQPAPAKACGSDESDPTGSDSSCGGNDNSGDNQAGDRPGDGGD